MTDTDQHVIEAFDNRVERRNERRDFFKAALGAAAVAGAGVAAVTLAGPAVAQTITDADVLNFALNLEYLEAQFYLFALNGSGLAAADTDGYLTAGTLVAGGTVVAGQKVDFSGDAVVASYAKEIAADELAHVRFLRAQLNGARVPMPNIDVSPAAFNKAAVAAGIATAAAPFNPYLSPENFLLGAFIFEDVGVTAYKGAAPLLTSKVYLEAAAGILAVEAYHASIVRTSLYSKGIAAPAKMLIEATEAISNLRDTLDGSPTADLVKGIGPDDDQGVANIAGAYGVGSNIVPLNSNGLAFSRSTGQVLNIVYGNTTTPSGLFFPNGVNGTFKANA
ncbi:ferritin-like domain-containing protein [Sphingomonas endolithica]|uniref:ferritin-like domain-containing protein n=1 Tax=Sphingomonas endolithica TaxID=2972485 RepID=UPI0021AE69AA|nr:ferritin-like domain-containing protein [Sphingomonas sp. ZFBP2030]